MTQAGSVANSGPETRISTVIGDRLCIRCHFNLSGQPVVRESVYGMAIVRCPECSTIASLQEHPLLGKWAGRFAAALAAIWLFLLIGGVFGTAGILFGMTEGCINMGSARYAEEIARRHAEWFATASELDRSSIARVYGGVVPASVPVNAYTWIDSTWWGKQDSAAILAEMGGFGKALSPEVITPLFWLFFIAVLLGAVWSVFLLHVRRWRLLVFAILPTALALLFAYMTNNSASTTVRWGMAGSVYAIQEAQLVLWPGIAALCLSLAFLALCLGAWLGRPLVRLLARMLLPPRMLGSLAYLWIAEGKRIPRPRGP